MKHVEKLGIQCFLVTSSDPETAAEFIAGHQLEEEFALDRRYLTVSSGDRAKVYGEIVAVAQKGCVLFDDSPSNLAEGKRIGMLTVGVATTHPVGAFTADVVFDGPLNTAALPSEG